MQAEVSGECRVASGERTQLDLWAEHRETIDAVVEAIEEAERRRLLEWNGFKKPLDFACELYGIDRAALDRERRELYEGIKP